MRSNDEVCGGYTLKSFHSDSPRLWIASKERVWSPLHQEYRLRSLFYGHL
jgi:hypothetical protein